MGLLALPAELLEDILVLLAQSDYPATIGHLARTCKAMNRLIYSPADKHLWRRIFLTTFDDPRMISESPGVYYKQMPRISFNTSC